MIPNYMENPKVSFIKSLFGYEGPSSEEVFIDVEDGSAFLTAFPEDDGELSTRDIDLLKTLGLVGLLSGRPFETDGGTVVSVQTSQVLSTLRLTVPQGVLTLVFEGEGPVDTDIGERLSDLVRSECMEVVYDENQ